MHNMFICAVGYQEIQKTSHTKRQCKNCPQDNRKTVRLQGYRKDEEIIILIYL